MLSEKRMRSLYEKRVSPNLAGEVFSATRMEVSRVILEFPTPFHRLRFFYGRLPKRMGIKVLYELPLINSIAAEVPTERLLELIPRAGVKMAWADAKVCPCLDVAVQAIHAEIAHQQGINGAGVTVAVIDTGIAPHPDLAPVEERIIGWRDFVNGRTEPYDDQGHGTHVAGIIAGDGLESKGRYRGVAPGARLVGVKVLDEEGGSPTSRVIAGIQWAVEQKERYGIRVINISLGGPVEKGFKSDPMSKAVEKAWRQGLVVCAAAGNTGPESGTITTPGIAPSVITVGSIDDKGTIPRRDDSIDDFSSRGPTIDRLSKPDLIAPGDRITSLKPGGGYTTLSGTSMATPMVSGAVALLLEKDPKLTPDQVKKLLLEAAEDRGYNPLEQGAGYLDLQPILEAPTDSASDEAQSDLTLLVLLLLGLTLVKGEGREELHGVFVNTLSRYFRKTNLLGLFNKEQQTTDATVFDLIKALSQWMSSAEGLGL